MKSGFLIKPYTHSPPYSSYTYEPQKTKGVCLQNAYTP